MQNILEHERSRKMRLRPPLAAFCAASRWRQGDVADVTIQMSQPASFTSFSNVPTAIPTFVPGPSWTAQSQKSPLPHLTGCLQDDSTPLRLPPPPPPPHHMQRHATLGPEMSQVLRSHRRQHPHRCCHPPPKRHRATNYHTSEFTSIIIIRHHSASHGNDKLCAKIGNKYGETRYQRFATWPPRPWPRYNCAPHWRNTWLLLQWTTLVEVVSCFQVKFEEAAAACVKNSDRPVETWTGD